MSYRVTCRINADLKMFLSVQQLMRNTLVRNKKILFCNGFTTFTHSSKSISLVRCSHRTFEDKTIFREQWNLKNFQRNQLIFLSSKPSSAESDKSKGKEDAEGDKSEVKLSLYQRFKKTYKEYWYVLLPVHLITSSIWFGCFYYLAASGIDVPTLLESLGAPDSWISNLRESKVGNVVLAYTLYKVATPLRYAVTLGCTTISITHLKRLGWIKPVPGPEQIRKMYREQKDAFKDLKTTYQDKMQVTKDELLKTKKEIEQQYNEAKEVFHKSVQETRYDLKEGIKSATDEWKLIGRLVSKKVSGGKKIKFCSRRSGEYEF